MARKLSSEVAKFITHLERGSLSKEVSEQLTKVLRTEQHLLACADQALEIARMQAEVESVTDKDIMESLSRYRAEVVSLMKMTNPEEEGFSFADCELQLDQVQHTYEAVRAELLQAGAQLRIPIPAMIDILEQNSRIERMPRQMVKAMRFLSDISMVAQVREPEPEPSRESETSETVTE